MRHARGDERRLKDLRAGLPRDRPELRLDLTDNHFFRWWVDELTLEADRLQFANPAFRKELGYWIGQGVFGMPRVVSRLGRLAGSRLDLGEPVA